MNPQDIIDRLDGWTQLRIDLYRDGLYSPIFDSRDTPGYYGDLCNLVNPAIDVSELEVTEIALEDNHIVLRCE